MITHHSRAYTRPFLTIVPLLSFYSLLPSIYIEANTIPYNVYNYDLTTPQFTPDGRLKQVEYACAAPSNSMPMLILPFSVPIVRGDDNRDALGTEFEFGLIIATISPPPPPLQTDDDHRARSTVPISDSTTATTSTTTTGSNGRGRRGQSRIIELTIPSSSSSSSSLNSGCHSVVVGLNGVLSDNVSLLQTARDSIQSYHSMYGAHRGASVSLSNGRGRGVSVDAAGMVATSIANRCQEHSFGGGIRPFGASMVVCGLDGSTDGGGGRLVVHVTDPSGAIASYPYGAFRRTYNNNNNEEESEGTTDVDHDRSDLTDVIIIGGQEQSNVALKRRVLEQLQRGTTSNRGMNGGERIKDLYADLIRRSLRAAIEGLAHLPPPGVTNVGDGGSWLSRRRKKSTKEGGGGGSGADGYEMVAQQIDLVLVTSSAGVQRLSKKQIVDLMASVQNTDKTSIS